jgi:hypothetical protein
MFYTRLGSPLLFALLLASVGSCDTSGSSSVLVDEEPAIDALELSASSGAAFLASEKVLPPDTTMADRRLIMVDGERLELRKAQRPPPN